MLYPQKNSAKRNNSIIKNSFLILLVIAIILIIINHFTTPGIKWAGCFNAGMLYIWITIVYSLNRNINTSRHLFIQLIALSSLFIYIDIKQGFLGWSINYAIPIVIMIINIAMLILSITSYNYVKYAFYQVLIVIVSLIPLFFIYENMTNNKTLNIIAVGICGLNLLISLIFHFKDLRTELIRKFHI